MKFIDLFSGIGGFRLGMQQNGHECVGHCEIDKYADASYRAMHNVKESEWYANDITKVTDEFIRHNLRDRNIEVICAGFPCQSFSIAGKRRGFEDTRGTLFFDVCRFAKILRPKYLFLENVRGLLSHDNGNTFETILAALADIGYDAEWEVYNTKRWLPQNRERVFIIGHLRESSGRKIFPLPEDGRQTDETNIIQVGNVHQEDRQRINPHTGRVYSADGICPCLNTMGGGGLEPKIAIPCLTPNRAEKRQNGRRFKEDGDDMFTLTAQDVHGVMVKEATKQGYSIAKEGDSINLAVPGSKTRRGRVGKGIANTLDTSCNQGVMIPSHIPGPQDVNNTLRASGDQTPTPKHNFDTIYDGVRIRRLSPLECWRLQGFPDALFYKAQTITSDSQLYKQAGNSVSVPVIKAIAERII